MEITPADRDLAQKMISQFSPEIKLEHRRHIARAAFIATLRAITKKMPFASDLDAEIKELADALFLSEEITPRKT